MESFLKLMKTLGVVRLSIMAGVIVGVGMFLFYLTGRMTSPEMALLYGDLDVGDAGRIVAKLEDRGVDVQIGGGGTQVYVPIDMVARLRMDMAEAGLPNGGSSVGYEVFDKSESLGSTFFIQNINHIRALEGELSRTIRTISRVASARVHLVLPKREVFQRKAQEPSASIVIRMQGSARLDSSRVQAIQHLVASAVPALTPHQVSIVDDRGNLLSRKDHDSMTAHMREADEMQQNFQVRLVRSIESMVEQVVGPGKVRAEVSVDLDFDRLSESREIFDPNGQVARSSQTITEKSTSQEGSSSGGAATVANEIPGVQSGADAGNSNSGNRSEETINYEVSKTIRQFVKESGSIKKLSVAVLVDGVYVKNADGTRGAYEERPLEQLQQIQKLVETSLGVDPERGDRIEIINMQFAPPQPLNEIADVNTLMGFERHQVVRIIEVAILGLVALMTMLMVVKPLINRFFRALELKTPAAEVLNAEGGKPLLSQDSGLQQQAGQTNSKTERKSSGLNTPGVSVQVAENEQEFVQTGGARVEIQNIKGNQGSAHPLDQMIQVKQIQGEVRASSLSRISDIIEDNLTETVSIIREWLTEERA